MANSSETGSTSLKSSEVTPEQEYFLYELETSDAGSIGLVLRAIYDGGDVHKFMRALERKIKHYDKDIERLCNFHYNGFIEAIRELLQVKQQCQQLKEQIVNIDQHLDESSKALMSKADELVRYRKMQKNIASAIDSVSLCLPVLEKYSKLEEQMEAKRYYPALKTLEQLEHTYLPRVERYRFAQQFKTNILSMRNQIKDASFSEFTDFLENIRKISGKIGEVALRHAAENMDVGAAARRVRRFRLQSVEKKTAGAVDEEEEFSAQDMIDFSPVYRCCHIFSVLNDRDSFETYYRTQRSEQAKLAFRPPERMHGTLEAYLKYFHEVIGFLVIEDHVMHTAAGLVTREYRDDLWTLALENVHRTLNNHFGNCTDAKVMLTIKKFILLFALTLKGYGFQVQAFYRLLQNFRDQYNEILMTECCSRFDEIMRTDTYTPITVENEEEFRSVVKRFPIYHKALEQEKFPKKFPFSNFLPLMYDHVKEYVGECLKFTEDLGLSQTDVDDTVRRYTNVLLERISGSLKALVANRRLTLVQLVQITINIGYLEKSCDSLEQYITSLTGATQSSAHAVKLKQGAYMFADARTEVEQQIYDALNRKITDFLELANYDWDLTEPTGQASGFIVDLIAFLNSTFLSFTNLPVSLARAACMNACKHLASSLMKILLDADIKSLTMGAMEQFNLDVIQCELFASQCPVPGLDGETLSLTFAELRQVLDLFMTWDWSAYLADFGQEKSKYVRVSPSAAIIVLEKMIECDRKRSMFSKSKDKDKKKLLDTVVKQLRTLANGAA